MTDESDEDVFEMELEADEGEGEEGDGEEAEEEQERPRPKKKKKTASKTKKREGGAEPKGSGGKTPGKKGRRPKKRAGREKKTLRGTGGRIKRFLTTWSRKKIAVVVLLLVVIVSFYAVLKSNVFGRLAGDEDGEGKNEPPVAVLRAEEDLGFTVDVPSYFDATGCKDPDGEIQSIKWDFDDRNGVDWEKPDRESKGTSVAKTGEWTYEEAGTYTVTIRVTDNDGASAEDSVTINVTRKPVQIDLEVIKVAGEFQIFYGSYYLTVSTILNSDGDANIEEFAYRIYRGTPGQEENLTQGAVSALPESPTRDVSFQDNDDDGEFSSGDSFQINLDLFSDETRPERGDTFVLEYIPSGAESANETLT